MTTTFHRIWFGKAAIPPTYEAYWHAWQRQCPSSRFMTWTDADLDRLPATRAAVGRFEHMTSLADLGSYEILHMEGGIYLDCDVRPWGYFDPSEMVEELTVCNESEQTDICSVGFIGSPPGHPIFAELVDHIGRSSLAGLSPVMATGPGLFGAALKRHPHRRLPTAAFYPYYYDEPMSVLRLRDLSQTLGVHVWGGSWLDGSVKRDKALHMLRRGDTVESAAIVAKLPDHLSQDVAAAIDAIRDMRQTTLQVAPSLFPGLAVRPEDRPAFEFAKVVDWLLGKDPDRMVWQIGAADGIVADPLRPLLINYDPPAILLEPNPHVFAMLERSYAGNRNSRLRCVAYAAEGGEIILNAVHPNRAAELDLPDWVFGISSVFDDRKALGGRTIDAALTEQIQRCVDRISVPAIAFATMQAESGGRNPDILVVDAEGMDREIIGDILAHGAKPLAFQVDVRCLDPVDQQALVTSLEADYALIAFGNDIAAYRHDVLIDYARALYIDHGMPTIFAGAVAAINGLGGVESIAAHG